MPRQISENRTRKEMIDPQLEKTGWYLRDWSRQAEYVLLLSVLYRAFKGEL
jgi:type I site-specific restriction endonuclease